MAIKFLKKGIRSDGEYIPVHYSRGSYTKESGFPEGTITIYAKKYNKRLPLALNPRNDSDSRTDYFETDRARIFPSSKHYKKVMKYI